MKVQIVLTKQVITAIEIVLARYTGTSVVVKNYNQTFMSTFIIFPITAWYCIK